MAKADSGQVRALAAAYAPGEAGSRALALHADPEWSGPDVLDGDGRRLRVVPCPSPLAVRAALVDHRDAGELLVLLTPCRGSELGLDVQARLCKGDVLPLDPFSSVLALFRATVLDPQLVHERALLDDLIALAPAGGWADRHGTGGVLDAGTAWRAWHRARLDLDGPPDDLAGLVGLGADPAVAPAIAALPADRRDRLGARWAETLGDLAPLLVDLVAAGRGPDLAALGLVAEVLWAPTDRPELAATQTVARARLEPVLGRDRVTASAAASWGAAARQVLAADTRRSSDAVDAAERILADAGAASLAVLSDALPRGFELRLAVLADALHAGDLDRSVAALRWVERHERAARRGHRVQAATAAVRLLRRRATVTATAPAEPTTFAQAAAAYALDGAFVDRAVRLLDDGDQVPELAAAYAALAADAAAGRAGEVASFVARLAEWSQAEPVADDRIVPLEHLLDRVVVPVAHDAPVLLVVCDGMALPVAHDLLDDLLAEGWAPAAPDERDGWPTGVALLPTVTEASRASLLTGTRTVGGQDVERGGFAAHPGLRAVSSPTRPPVLLHKAALVGPSGAALPDDVRRLVADPDQRVVGVVVNAVDDHLARGNQVRVGWDLNALRPLSWLLDAAREAGRVVVVTADHGHVLHRADAIVRQLPGGGERWRTAPPPAGDGEVELAGPRVLLGGGRVVVPADARLRYGGHKHGYHGGATPEEVLVPVAVLARGLPDGWHHHPLAAPAWWTGHEAVAAPAVPARPAPAPAPTTPAGQASLFEPADQVPAAGASWVDALLASPAFVDHRARVRLPRPMPDDRLRRYLDAIAANGDAIPLPALAARTGEPADTLRMALSLVQRLVNLDGAEILAVRADGTVSLNRELAGLQFGIGT